MQDKVNQFFRTIPMAKAVLLAVVFLLSAAFARGAAGGSRHPQKKTPQWQTTN